MTTISYFFQFEDGNEARFDVDFERDSKKAEARSDLPEWTELDYKKCQSCPLSSSERARCPAAVDALDIVERFRDSLSFHTADVKVVGPDRTYSKKTDLQTALQSLLGLVMATSGCPTLSKFRGLAHMHLPFATTQETVYRTCAHHLLRQFFNAKGGAKPDLQLTELKTLYEEVQTVNRAFLDRVRAAAEKDANLNALVNLFSISVLVTVSLDDGLAELEHLFS